MDSMLDDFNSKKGRTLAELVIEFVGGAPLFDVLAKAYLLGAADADEVREILDNQEG